jgi:hypothetical protein
LKSDIKKIDYIPGVRQKCKLLIFLCTMIILLYNSCRVTDDKNPERENINDITYSWIAKEKDILYHMSLPAQMTTIFENSEFPYQQDMPNNPDSLINYFTPEKIAANLGVYGADLGYIRVMKQEEETTNYLLAVYALAGKLNIPREIYSDLIINLDNYLAKPDEMAVQIDSIYTSVALFLRNSQREQLTAMILLGGWIESLYLASQIYMKTPENTDLLEQIAEQKYSLNYLINQLNNFQEEESILQYTLMLKNLKRSYDKIQIFYKKGDVVVDTIQKTISANEYQIITSQAAITEIALKIGSIRTRLIR